jgi:hypothetical protein
MMPRDAPQEVRQAEAGRGGRAQAIDELAARTMAGIRARLAHRDRHLRPSQPHAQRETRQSATDDFNGSHHARFVAIMR